MRRYPWLSLLLVALIGTGCVLSASEEVAPTTVGDAATWTLTPSETELPPPTETPTPAEAAEATDEVTAEVTDEVTEESLLEPTEPALQVTTQTAIPTATSSPTDTATATNTATATATNTATPTATLTEAVSALIQEGTAVAQDNVPEPVDDPAQDAPQQGGDGQITDNEATATQIIANATSTAEFLLTETAIAGDFGDVTDTPVPVDTMVPDDGLGSGVELTPTTQAQPPANVQPGADCIHEVRQADRSLYRLSLAYGVPILSIAQASGITNPDLIRVGQRLTIPGCGTTGGVPPATSTPGPNANANLGFGGPGAGLGVTPPNGDCTWGTSVVFPGGCPTGGTGGGGNTGGGNAGSGDVGTGGPGTGQQAVHIVAQGETLFEISIRYGVPIESIAAANGIADYNSILFNQRLIIPTQ